jgi:Peptidase family C25
MSYWTPYYASDLPYADIDDDGLPDLILGRLPVRNVAEIVRYTAKMNSYFTNPVLASDADAMFYTRTFDYGPSLGAYLEQKAASLEDYFPATVTMERHTEGPDGDVPYYGRDAFGTGLINQGKGVMLWMGTESGPTLLLETGIGDIFDPLDPISPPEHFGAWLGLSCGMAAFDMTKYPQMWGTLRGSYLEEKLLRQNVGPDSSYRPNTGHPTGGKLPFCDGVTETDLPSREFVR